MTKTKLVTKLNKYFNLMTAADLIYQVTDKKGKAIINQIQWEEEQAIINNLITELKITPKKGAK